MLGTTEWLHKLCPLEWYSAPRNVNEVSILVLSVCNAADWLVVDVGKPFNLQRRTWLNQAGKQIKQATGPSLTGSVDVTQLLLAFGREIVTSL
jgi:hypothetical protein